MAEENLPIKFFQKRQKDERDTEGGGGGKPPQWIDASSVGEKSIYIRQVLDNVSHSLAEKVEQLHSVCSKIKSKFRRSCQNLS